MVYRTKTYIAADWTGDNDAVEILHKWNNSRHWSLSFSDAHELTQAKDTSLKCSIKASLRERMNASKTFILIVGDNTRTITNGSCQYCRNYNAFIHGCGVGRSTSYSSFVQYECELAVKAGIRIIVLYNQASVDRHKCPEILRDKGTHVPMVFIQDGKYYWDYQAVRNALNV